MDDMEESTFWETVTPAIDHEETVPSSSGERLFGLFFFLPVSIASAIGILFVIFNPDNSLKEQVGLCFISPCFALLPLSLMSLFLQLVCTETISINTEKGTIEKSTTFWGKEMYQEKELINEVKLVDVYESGDEDTTHSISIKGNNAHGEKWSLDITRFHRPLYLSGKGSMDRFRISMIKTGERYGDMLGVEVKNNITLGHVSRNLRKEFDLD